MFRQLKSEILGLSNSDYTVIYAVLAAILLFLLYFAYNAFRRFRYMDGTATSKIRSAAQGHVELKGLGEFLPEDTIISPFSGRRCIWYHCTIDKKQRRGKRTTWTNISDERSDHLFRIVDDTGDCIIDPDDAYVVPETDLTWYGSSTDRRAHPPGTRRLISLGIGNYRFRERLILPATRIYALGWFRTIHSNPSDTLISKQAEDLVRQWKIQPQRYLRKFDFDANGKIQKDEWKAIRGAARGEVLAQLSKQKQQHHVLSRPTDRRQPFILSARPEEDLVDSRKFRAYAAVSAAFAIFSVLVIMYSIRPLLPV
ncbi:MAG: GIDE domain-containing protein [Gammaproteobacteria bacterium]|jgi:hypothetical protein